MEYWVTAGEQPYMGAWLILLAAVFDMLDGLAARALQVFSPIGKDLDSLADVVSFGVAPSMILFKMLWAAHMSQPNALDVSMFAMLPAFLVACFGALRLARFNTMKDTPKGYFTGMPIPAAGLFVASLPLINWYRLDIGAYFQGRWTIYLIIAVLCGLMISKIRFMKLMPPSFKPANIWPQLVLLVAAVAGWFVVNVAVIPILFVLYILLSFVHKPSEA